MAEISVEGKQVLKTIGSGELTFSQIQKKLGENFPVGAEVGLLGQMGLLEEVDGYLSVTDVGIKVAAIEGTEIPERLESEMVATIKQAQGVVINKPGEAEAQYRKGAGITEPTETDAMRQYKEGLARQQGKPVNARSARYEPQGSTSDGDLPEEDEPIVEAAEELEAPKQVLEVRAASTSVSESSALCKCPVFGKANINFCTIACLFYKKSIQSCDMDERLAERMKP